MQNYLDKDIVPASNRPGHSYREVDNREKLICVVCKTPLDVYSSIRDYNLAEASDCYYTTCSPVCNNLFTTNPLPYEKKMKAMDSDHKMVFYNVLIAGMVILGVAMTICITVHLSTRDTNARELAEAKAAIELQLKSIAAIEEMIKAGADPIRAYCAIASEKDPSCIIHFAK